MLYSSRGAYAPCALKQDDDIIIDDRLSIQCAHARCLIQA
jgi:hypothetical protein